MANTRQGLIYSRKRNIMNMKAIEIERYEYSCGSFFLNLYIAC